MDAAAPGWSRSSDPASRSSARAARFAESRSASTPAACRASRCTRVRLQVLVRDKWRCRRCNGFAFEVHHVKPIAEDGDAFDDSNLEARCRGCHMNEHGKGTSRDWRRLLAEVLT